MRVGASFVVSISWGFNGPICADGSWASERGRDRLNLFPPQPWDPPCGLPNWQWVGPTRYETVVKGMHGLRGKQVKILSRLMPRGRGCQRLEECYDPRMLAERRDLEW